MLVRMVTSPKYNTEASIDDVSPAKVPFIGLQAWYPLRKSSMRLTRKNPPINPIRCYSKTMNNTK